MNAAILRRLARLVSEATHPLTDPLDARPYSDEERADWRHAHVTVDRWWIDDARYGGSGKEFLGFKLTPAGVAEPTFELDIDADGKLYRSGYITIPPADCDCECDPARPSDFERRAGCPRHSGCEKPPVRDLEAVLVVDRLGWEIVDQPIAGTGGIGVERIYGKDGRGVDRMIAIPVERPPRTYPRWSYVVRTGEPCHDVLAKYRAEREAARP